MNSFVKFRALFCLLVLLSSPMLIPALHADNKVLGEIELIGASKVEMRATVLSSPRRIAIVSPCAGAATARTRPVSETPRRARTLSPSYRD